jgi:hypothetical protein
MILRIMAGILAALFAWATPATSPGILMATFAALFAVFAIFGRDAADKVLDRLTGNRRQPPATKP